MNKYIEFLNKLTDKENAALIESVKNGFKVIFEGRFGNVKHPHDEDDPYLEGGDDDEGNEEEHIKDVNGVLLKKGDKIIYTDSNEKWQMATISYCSSTYSMTEGWIHPEDGWYPPEPKYEELESEYLKVEKDGVEFTFDLSNEFYSAKEAAVDIEKDPSDIETFPEDQRVNIFNMFTDSFGKGFQKNPSAIQLFPEDQRINIKKSLEKYNIDWKGY